MNNGQCQENGAGHLTNRYHHFLEGMNSLPGADHQSRVTQVKQVIPHQ